MPLRSSAACWACCAGLAITVASLARADDVLWTYTAGGYVNSVQVLPNGDVLFADKQNDRILEVAPTPPNGGVEVGHVFGIIAPDYGFRLPNGHTLVADTGEQRVIDVDPSGAVIWSFGDGGIACDNQSLYYPASIGALTNGDYLVVDSIHNRLLEIQPDGGFAWVYGNADCSLGGGSGQLNQPFHAEQLPDGGVLLCDYGNGRVLELLWPPAGTGPLWEYTGDDAGILPTRAHLLANGNFLISDPNGMRVIEVTPAFPSGGTIVWQYGSTGDAGSAPGLLSAPYDAWRTSEGVTVIADHGNARVIAVGPDGGFFGAMDSGMDAGGPDAGSVDAGPVDAGAPDAAVPLDAGGADAGSNDRLGIGCGCHAGASPAWTVILLLLLLLTRPRRARAEPGGAN